MNPSIRVAKIYNCPLLKREIEAGECCDIQTVRGGLVKQDSLTPKFDKEQAIQLCDKCPYKQL